MKAFLATTCIVTGALLAGGCATKKYVRNTEAPIQAKVDQVGEQTTQNTNQITDTKNQVKDVDERAQNGISGANEKAGTADQHASDAMNHANDAMNKATTADQKADQNAQGLNSVRSAVENIDDYKLQTSVTVPFAFDKYKLTTDAQQQLDSLVQNVQSDKRFFFTVEGFTDRTGAVSYNDALSRKRADAVVQYLVAKQNIPVYRIHVIGLGEANPVDDAHTRAARAKNRRVEVQVFTADEVTAGLGAQASANRDATGHNDK
jgi:OmpA-OmpF porin, OOP family